MFNLHPVLIEKIEKLEEFTEKYPEYIGKITRHDIADMFIRSALSMYGEKIGRKWYEYTQRTS